MGCKSRWNLRFIAGAFAWLAGAGLAGAIGLTNGPNYWTVWKTVSNAQYKVTLSITGLPTVEWRAGFMTLPVLGMNFNYSKGIRGGASPCWNDRDEKPGAWEEVAFRETVTPTGKTWRVAGLCEGFGIDQIMVMSEDMIQYTYVLRSLFPSRDVGGVDLSSVFYRVRKDDILSCRVKPDKGEPVTVELNRNFAPVKAEGFKRMTIATTNTVMTMDLNVEGCPIRMELLGSKGNLAADRASVARWGVAPLGRQVYHTGTEIHLTLTIRFAAAAGPQP